MLWEISSAKLARLNFSSKINGLEKLQSVHMDLILMFFAHSFCFHLVGSVIMFFFFTVDCVLTTKEVKSKHSRNPSTYFYQVDTFFFHSSVDAFYHSWNLQKLQLLFMFFLKLVAYMDTLSSSQLYFFFMLLARLLFYELFSPCSWQNIDKKYGDQYLYDVFVIVYALKTITVFYMF